MNLLEIVLLAFAPVVYHLVNLLADPHDAFGLCRDGLDLVALSLDPSGFGVELGTEMVDLVIGVVIEHGAEGLCTFALGSWRKLSRGSKGRGVLAHATGAEGESLLRFGLLSLSEIATAEVYEHWLFVADIVNHFSLWICFVYDK